ncbi:conserved oligomeric Golgi complex subunit 2 [Tetranychus urticae]|uniref:Conserved oligomeric Golgi complex subunit 2 n=1 Tax=Tetranychus urticae TaxID=32264 RepID=T1KWJ2_TETUR|nr:conserved oligomeric Golgi complex subunit 2 [Tetranychus urticae]
MDVSALPQVNEGFCFTGEEFLQDNFTVDDFIKNHRNDISLEQLRQDLSSYLRTCRLALIDTINEDYSDFINLMDDLVGLDTNINNLIEPLESIRNDIKLVEDDFAASLNEISGRMQQLQLTHQKRKQIELILNVHRNLQKVESLCTAIENSDTETADLKPDITLIERIAIQMEEIVVNLEYNNSGPLKIFTSAELESKSRNLTERVRRIMEKSFVQIISRSDGSKIQRFYTIFLLNGQLNVLEKMLIGRIRPYLISVISESRLEALGTEKFFEDVKNLILSQFNVFFHLEDDCSIWFISRIWNELVSSLTLLSPSLFASGNPDQFHSNYTATIKFLDSLKVEIQKDGKLPINLQLHLLILKFNTQVYFRIRFQEIASRFEYALKQPYTYQPQEEKKFTISPLIVLLESINDCWSTERIYLPPLFINFWKLTLQLIARCTVWLSTIQLSDLFIENVTSITESSRLKCSLLSLIFSQTEKTLNQIRDIYKETILPLKPDNFDEKLLQESLEDGLLMIAETGLPNIVKLTKECLVNKNLT